MNTEEILKGVREKRFKDNVPQENIGERSEKFKKLLEGRIKRGHYFELKEIGANLPYVANILAYTESEREKDVKFVQERKKPHLWKDWKKVQKVVNSYPEDFQKRLLLEFAGESFRIGLEKKGHKMRYLEQMGKKLPKWSEVDRMKLPKKPPEWYLNRAILDLGSYFEAITPLGVRKIEERRRYALIGKLVYDFDLLKQRFSEDVIKKDEEESVVIDRVKKRAKAIPSRIWKMHIQGVKESLHKRSSPSLP